MSQNINMHCTLSKRASQTILFRPEFKDILLRLLIATFLFSRFLRHYQYNDLCIWAGHNQKSHTWPSKSSSTLQRAFCFVWNSALSILTLTRPHLLNQCDATTRSSWLNCDDEAVYWVSKGHYEAVAVGNWWYWVQTWNLSKNLQDRRFQGKEFTQKTRNFRDLLNRDKKCVNALNWDKTGKKSLFYQFILAQHQ